MFDLLKTFQVLLKQSICDHCLGRSCGHLLSGLTNQDRGRSIKNTIALSIDAGEKIDVCMSNFQHYKFLHITPSMEDIHPCIICENFFLEKINDIASRIVEQISKYQFSSFVVGSSMTESSDKRFQAYFPSLKLTHQEALKKEINRELGKKIEKMIKKKVKLQDPDIVVLVDFKTTSVTVHVKSLFIQGTYQKLTRYGVAQARWLCTRCEGENCSKCHGTGQLYETSLQELIGDPLQEISQGIGTSFHGSGREDIDVRCLGNRPFVLEVKNPKIRNIDLDKINTSVNQSKKIQVHQLKFSDKKYIRKIKDAAYDKTYAADILFSKILDPASLSCIDTLNNTTIHQWTPQRVLHRRANLERKRVVKNISYKILSPKELRVTIHGEAGLYIKELIHGDDGRTQPSIAQLIQNFVQNISLDVIRIHT